MADTVELRFNTLTGTCTLTEEELVLTEEEVESRIRYTDIDKASVRSKKLGAQPLLVIERNGEELLLPVRTRRLAEQAVDIIRRHKASSVKV